jgi:hypothetical protein
MRPREKEDLTRVVFFVSGAFLATAILVVIAWLAGLGGERATSQPQQANNADPVEIERLNAEIVSLKLQMKQQAKKANPEPELKPQEKPKQPKDDPPKAAKGKPGFFGALPEGIDVKHAQIIRGYLKDNLPTGDWEEVEWRARPFDEGHLTDLSETVAQLSQDADDRLSQRFGGKAPARPKVSLPPGVETTLKLRAVNDEGNRKVVTVGVIQRGDTWKFMNLQNDHYVGFDLEDGPQ